LNDLEYLIHLKVRLVDGTLDVRLLLVSDSTIRISVARGGSGGVGWRPIHPSMWAADALFLCGSRTSCIVELPACAQLCKFNIHDHRR